MTRQKRLCRRLSLIHHLRNEEETGTSSLLQRPLGWLLGTRYSSIGQFFPLSPVTVLEVFAKVNSAQFPSRF